MRVCYFDGTTAVQLGDRVEVRVLLRKHSGRLVYVPGVSAPNAKFEYNGLRWAAIRLENGSLVATVVLHKTGTLKKKIRLLGRDTSPCELITPESREFE
jgi:hypothetical protein